MNFLILLLMNILQFLIFQPFNAIPLMQILRIDQKLKYQHSLNIYQKLFEALVFKRSYLKDDNIKKMSLSFCILFRR